MARCDHADNTYAYDYVLDRFDRSERFILETAANAGRSEGAAQSASGAGPCPAAFDRLRAADNELITKAELLPAR